MGLVIGFVTALAAGGRLGEISINITLDQIATALVIGLFCGLILVSSNKNARDRLLLPASPRRIILVGLIGGFWEHNQSLDRNPHRQWRGRFRNDFIWEKSKQRFHAPKTLSP
jgi:hypothetical protein